VFVFVVLKFELSASPLIGRHSFWSMPLALVFLCWYWGLNSGPQSSYFKLPTVVGMTATYHYVQFFFPLRCVLTNFFPQAGFPISVQSPK
jgi:hypothetical protein